MAKTKRKSSDDSPSKSLYCAVPEVADRQLEAITDTNRLSLIRYNEKKWLSGTVLHYHFLDAPAAYKGAKKQKDVVRQAFATWKALDIGLTFTEVDHAEDAEIRIAFERNNRSWSYVGRDCIDIVTDPAQPTMNLGWDLTQPGGEDTALHEIGHTLGFSHEHQNPISGIVWNEQAVYDYFSGPPNNWKPDMIDHNILKKIDRELVSGSVWDPDSIMHYGFERGLINIPEIYRTSPLRPAPGLSRLDIDRVKHFYPPITGKPQPIFPFMSAKLNLQPGEQAEFEFQPAMSREYNIQTFGNMDAVVVLFRHANGKADYINGDDNSGFGRNASLTARLERGGNYLIRVRLYHSRTAGDCAVMVS